VSFIKRFHSSIRSRAAASTRNIPFPVFISTSGRRLKSFLVFVLTDSREYINVHVYIFSADRLQTCRLQPLPASQPALPTTVASLVVGYVDVVYLLYVSLT